MSFSQFVFGKCRVTAKEKDTLKLLNLLLASGIVYYSLRVRDGEDTVLYASHASAARLACVASASGIALSVESAGGLPHMLRALRKRAGLCVGVLLSLVLICLAQGVLWEVRVVGETSVGEARIKELLAEHGLGVGVRLANLDVDRIQTECARDSDEVAWISVNVFGTVAQVEVVEERRVDEAKPRADGANLVAKCDGVVVGYELAAGEPCRAIGETVKKGELLASGVIDSGRFAWRCVYARGAVYAQTYKKAALAVPLAYTKKTAVKRKICEISLFFFGRELKLFKNSGNSSAMCDTISSIKYLYSTSEHTVPVGIALKSAVHYERETAYRTTSEASEYARFELERKIAALGDGVRVVRKKIFESESEGLLTLVYELYCVEDIAETREFSVSVGE